MTKYVSDCCEATIINGDPETEPEFFCSKCQQPCHEVCAECLDTGLVDGGYCECYEGSRQIEQDELRMARRVDEMVDREIERRKLGE